MELIKTFRKYGCTLRMWDTFERDNRGSTYIKYELKHGKKVIFTGKDFSPSPMHAIDSLDSVAALLGFLTLQPGDTDDEYFKDHTPEQFEWIESDACEELRLWLYDREAKESD